MVVQGGGGGHVEVYDFGWVGVKSNGVWECARRKARRRGVDDYNFIKRLGRRMTERHCWGEGSGEVEEVEGKGKKSGLK